MVKERKLINGTNSFNMDSFNKVCEALEEDCAVEVYIDCIGFTRATIEGREYAKHLEDKYGERLLTIIQYGVNYNTYTFVLKD